MGAKSTMWKSFEIRNKAKAKKGETLSKRITVPENMRPTKESDENLGKKIAWSIKQNSGSENYR